MFRPSKSFWLSWILATVISSAIGFTLSTISSTFSDEYHLVPSVLVFIAIGSVIMSLGQWIVLRTRLLSAWRWIPATTVGIVLGGTFSIWITATLLESSFSFEHEWIDAFLMSSITGVIIGVLQWLALTRDVKLFPWILVSALNWGFGITALAFISGFMIDHNIQLGYFNAPLGGAVIGVLVGTINGAFVESTLIKTARKSIDLAVHAS